MFWWFLSIKHLTSLRVKGLRSIRTDSVICTLRSSMFYIRNIFTPSIFRQFNIQKSMVTRIIYTCEVGYRHENKKIFINLTLCYTWKRLRLRKKVLSTLTMNTSRRFLLLHRLMYEKLLVFLNYIFPILIHSIT